MIASLSGRVAALGANWAVLEVQGVGYRLTCTPATAAGLRPGEPASLFTTLIVREDSLTLYGFESDLERETFELLQTASGVGPRLALAVVSVLAPAQVVQAIQAEQVTTLIKVPGIGRKGAEKIIIELRDKIAILGVEADEQVVDQPATHEAWREQVSAGLQSLGWSAKDAEAACEKVAPLVADEPEVSLGRLMKAALQSLARA